MPNNIIIGVTLQHYIAGNTQPTAIYARGGIRNLQSGRAIASGPQLIDIIPTLLNLGNLTNEGYALFHNQDSTNYIEVGTLADPDDLESTFTPMHKLLADSVYPGAGLVPGYIYFAKANTAPCWLDYRIFEA